MYWNKFIALLTSIVNASNHAKCESLSNEACEMQLLLIYILINTAENNITIHLNLNETDVLKVAILLTTYAMSMCSK